MTESFVRESIRVRAVCELLDMHRSQVYRACNDGDLEWHGIGRRGRRIYKDSVLSYQRSRNGTPTATPVAEPKKIRVKNPGHAAAMDFLKSAGLV
jgi:excisionase family DNA binding protein